MDPDENSLEIANVFTQLFWTQMKTCAYVR